ncbi:MAG: SPOR domain-containing protein [Methylophagaceae bacterium]
MAARKNSRNKAKEKSLPWGPMLLSFAVGAFAMFLLHLKDNVPAEQPRAVAAEEQKTSKQVEPTFDFYTVLPEMEVVVNTPEQPTTASSPPKKESESSPEEKVSYLIQVGSFRNASDADGFKAKLALLGIESKVYAVTIDNKDTWHRVQIGPINGREKADALQAQLKQNEIKSLLMRAKRG